MVREPYRLPAYLSDLGGNDPDAHHGKPHNVIGIVRDYLHKSPRGRLLPGRTKFVSAFQAFRGTLPDIARAIRHRADEIGGITNYRTFICCVAEFLRRAGR